jgi:hypothetical protein
LLSADAEKMTTIQISGGSQYFKNARSLGTPDESRWSFQFQVSSFQKLELKT